MATNTAWTPWQYHLGFRYRARLYMGSASWEVVDSAGGSVPGGSGEIVGGTVQAAINAAIDYINRHDDDEFFDSDGDGIPDSQDYDPFGEGNWTVVSKSDAPHAAGRCFTIELQNTTINAGIGLDLFIWRVKDMTGAIRFTQSFPQRRADALKDAKGFVESLPDQEDCPSSKGGGVELNADSDVLRLAGFFVVGVAKGTLMAIVPIVAMSAAVGFMRRGSKYGAEVGS